MAQSGVEEFIRCGFEGINEEGKGTDNINIKRPVNIKIKPTLYDAYEEFLRRIRFDDKSDKPNGARGIATRAMRRDLQETGLLPTGPLSLIKKFATGE